VNELRRQAKAIEGEIETRTYLKASEHNIGLKNMMRPKSKQARSMIKMEERSRNRLV
jgi:hypothetical protein